MGCPPPSLPPQAGGGMSQSFVGQPVIDSTHSTIQIDTPQKLAPRPVLFYT